MPVYHRYQANIEIQTCMGNLAAAEHHLAGLLTLLELYAEKCKTDINDGQLHDGEVERYILMSVPMRDMAQQRLTSITKGTKSHHQR